MANDSVYFRAQADRARADADAAQLDNVRDRAMRSVAAFEAMAASAERVGAASTFDWSATDPVAAVEQLTGGRGVDLAIAAAPSHELAAQTLRLTAPGGRVLLFAGMPRSRPTAELDINEIHYKELTVTATTASSLRDCTEAARLLGSGLGDLGWMVTDAFSLDDAQAAAARAQDRAALKVVITPGATSTAGAMGSA